MNRTMKRILSALMCFMIVVISGTAMNAAAATNLPDSFLIGDQNGIRVSKDGEYYIEVNDILPGDVIEKKLTIQNLDVDSATVASSVPFNLTMRMEPVSQTGPVDLLDITRLELKLDGKVIYSGRCRGDDGVNAIQNALELGSYKPGQQRTLDITMTVGGNISMSDWTTGTSEAKFRWIFHAIRSVKEPPPKTGVLDYISYAVLLGGTALLFALLLFLKKKKQQQQRHVTPHM